MSDNDDNHGEEKSEQKNKKRSKARIIRRVCFNKEVGSEKHYRELIMLFTSWRDEITDLLANCASYQEHYLQCKTRSYYRTESAAVTHKLQNSQPIILKLLILHCMY